MRGAVRNPKVLQSQVVGLFDQLDHVSQDIERVRADMARVDDRISALSRQIQARQQLLDRRAAEAYMAGRAGWVESVLGASSFTEVGDALEFLGAVSRKDADLLLSLEHRREEIELERARLNALEKELRGRRERLHATAADLVEGLRLQRALVRASEEGTAADAEVGDAPAPQPPPAQPASSPSTSALGREAVIELVRGEFASLGSGTVELALCVAERESGFDPLAVNPTTGAAGLFQFLPSTWETLRELAGWTGASVFDARANVAVSAWTVARYGWHPWRSVAAACGA